MMCKDCIHYNICHYHIDEESLITVNGCLDFKDKELFVELPVKPGTVVYYIDWDYTDEDFSDKKAWFVEKVPFAARMIDGWGIDYFATEEEAGAQILRERQK